MRRQVEQGLAALCQIRTPQSSGSYLWAQSVPRFTLAPVALE